VTCAFGSRDDHDYNIDQFSNMFKGCQYNDENNGPLVNGTVRGDNIAYYDKDCKWGILMGYYIGVLVVGCASLSVIKFLKHYPRANAFGYANFAALCGAQQNMFLKVSVELLSTTLDPEGDGNQFKYSKTYLFIATVVALAICQIVALNAGLSRHEAVSYIPLYQAMLVIWGSTAGGIYFDEFRDLDTFRALMFALGITFIAAGLGALTLLVQKDATTVKEGEEDAYWSDAEAGTPKSSFKRSLSQGDLGGVDAAMSSSHSKNNVNVELNSASEVAGVDVDFASDSEATAVEGRL